MNLDLFLLLRFQAFTDWFQKWFGLNNFTLAKIIILVSTFFEVGFVYLPYFDDISDKIKKDILFFPILSLFGCVILLFHVERIFKKRPDQPNIAAVIFISLRMFSSVFGMLGLLDICQGIFFFKYIKSTQDLFFASHLIISGIKFVLIFFYSFIISCTPAPDSESLIKKKFKTLFHK